MKTSFSDWILNGIERLQTLDFGVFFACIVGYIIVMWVIASFWVYFDARRRYKNIWMVVFVTVLVIPFNFPALILYVMLRPEHTKDELTNIEESIANLFIAQGRLLTAPENSTINEENAQAPMSDPTITPEPDEIHILKENLLDPESPRMIKFRDAANNYIVSSKSFIEKTRSSILNSASMFGKKFPNENSSNSNTPIDVSSSEVNIVIEEKVVNLEGRNSKKLDPKTNRSKSVISKTKRKNVPEKKVEKKKPSQTRKSPPVKLVMK